MGCACKGLAPLAQHGGSHPQALIRRQSIGKTEPPRAWLRHVDDLGEGRGEANAVAEAGRMDDEEGEGGLREY